MYTQDVFAGNMELKSCEHRSFDVFWGERGISWQSFFVEGFLIDLRLSRSINQVPDIIGEEFLEERNSNLFCSGIKRKDHGRGKTDGIISQLVPTSKK